MSGKAIIAFLTDNNVPDAVAKFLTEIGHDVVKVRDVMAADSPDPVVAEAAMRDSRILISWDKDFNHQRFAARRFERLSRIGMSCSEVDGKTRIEENLDRIEFEVRRAQGRAVLIKISHSKYQARG